MTRFLPRPDSMTDPAPPRPSRSGPTPGGARCGATGKPVAGPAEPGRGAAHRAARGRRALALAAAAAVAACGVDGPPEPPQERPVSLSISGRVEAGVTGGG